VPTLPTHLAAPLAARIGGGRGAVPGRLLAAASVAALLPDADVAAFAFGIPYAHPFGHRGFFHSLSFAVLVAFAGAACLRIRGVSRVRAFLVLLLAAASHPLLDALTNGGLGVALAAPFSWKRYFFPWRPIRVSPLGVAALFTERGWRVLRSELIWVWGPALGLALFARRFRR
jgi:inner membrane protein